MVTVQVSADAIEALGRTLLSWETAVLDPLLPQLDSIAVLPGDFTDGTDLKTLIGTRRDNLKKAVQNIKTSLHEIGTQLENIAAHYRQAGDDTAIISTELKTLIEHLKTDLPGFMK
jgi:hypothetical protein